MRGLDKHETHGVASPSGARAGGHELNRVLLRLDDLELLDGNKLLGKNARHAAEYVRETHRVRIRSIRQLRPT